jgi:hypothetical protein
LEKFNWEEIKEKLAKSIRLESNKDELSIRITILDANVEDNKIIGNMLKSQEEMKQSLAHFINDGKPIDCDIDVNQEKKYIFIKYKDKKLWKKTYELFNDIFFGDYLKKMIEAMMGAFGGMFGRDE